MVAMQRNSMSKARIEVKAGTNVSKLAMMTLEI